MPVLSYKKRFDERINRLNLLEIVGEVAEWLKAPLSKSGSPERRRGFESHPLRHPTLKLRMASHTKMNSVKVGKQSYSADGALIRA